MFADNWCIKSNDRVYGPYSSQQLRKFAHEGRFIASSLIAPAGSKEWREASNETAFASFFGSTPGEGIPVKTFGRNDAGAREPRRARVLGQDPRKPEASEPAEPANFVLIFDVVSAAASRVEVAIMSLGPAFRLASNVWTVNCPLTAIGVRNAIAPHLRPNESLFVVDATKGRASWQNYAPEAHAKISAAFVHPRVNN